MYGDREGVESGEEPREGILEGDLAERVWIQGEVGWSEGVARVGVEEEGPVMGQLADKVVVSGEAHGAEPGPVNVRAGGEVIG